MFLKDSVQLYDYQEQCLKWMLRRERAREAPGGILSLDLGLGKTLMTMAVMSSNPVPKTLVIAPANLVAQWTSEFEKFTNCAPFVVDATSSNKGLVTTEILDAHAVVLTSLSTFSSMSNTIDNVLLSYSFDRIVIDECHLIRNKKTKSYKLVRRLESNIKWALTGTPVVKNDKNFTALLEFLGIFRVNLRYAAREYLFRRVKEDVFDLPKLSIEDLRADFQTQLEKDVYDEIVDNGRVTMKAYKAYADSEGRMQILKCLLRLRQCTSNISMVPKDESGDEYYDGPSTKLAMLESDILSSPIEKTLIFAHFHKEMNAIKDMLLSHGLESVVLHGKISYDDRTAAIKRFEQDRAVNFFILQSDAGSTGLNLQAASRIYLNSVHWNGTTDLQAIGRAHRIGQTKPVVVKRLIINDSIDDAIIGLQQKKLACAADLLGDERINNSLKGHKRKSEFKSLIESIFS